ncbi:TonB-dependent receptor plug domain-containing protein [Flavobacteriaceae bacterium MHTCC 0001]
MEANAKHQATGLVGANVYWLNTQVGTVTDIDGNFSIAYKSTYKQLIISYVGFKTDTLTIEAPKFVRHWLQPTDDLDEVTVTTRKQATARSLSKAENIINVSSDELLKAACCNLSESFETTPSIDVNFANAVSGARQIKMLGLTSPYILIATENIPSVRGASQAYGLSFIPGTWVESIQITKGAGSVVNGFESITGQINTELVKPSSDNKVFVNLYGASSERLELNTHINTKVNNKWYTGVYIHGNTHQKEHDVNNDGFLDMPLFHQINVMNRWQYIDTEKGIVSFINLKFLNDEKQTGELDFNPNTDKLSANRWGSEIDTQRYEVSAKFGYVNPEVPWQSLGIQTAFSNHKQASYFGLNVYDIQHHSLYTNAIYNSIISDTRHKIKTGLSYTYDDYDELVHTTDYKRTENSIGAFFEYSYNNLELLNLTAGVRVDHHNLLGTFVTPRLHLRYSPWQKSALKMSFGRGKRSANIFAENQQLFATSRMINVNSTLPFGRLEGAYGLHPEIAWNYGVSYLQKFNLFGKEADVIFDFYKTDFVNQVVVDWENPQEVSFYNLNGKSFANSFQTEFNYNAFTGFDLRMAYKFYDVKTDYDSGRLEQPLTPKHRIFTNVAYKTNTSDNGGRWKFDTTFNWLGKQRFPSTESNPVAYQLPERTPTITTLNAQITKVFSPKFEIYLGGENMTNVRQPNPILGADTPFGANFDTTFVYGPIFGSLYYTGLRFKIE